jgi:hypothetical protein
MCCGPHDYDYPNFGGKHERVDRSYGRVGSLFSDPMAYPTGGSSDSNLKEVEKRKRRDASDLFDDNGRSREGLERELEEIDPSRPRREPQPDQRPIPDTKEAFNQYQRPSPLKQWR